MLLKIAWPGGKRVGWSVASSSTGSRRTLSGMRWSVSGEALTDLPEREAEEQDAIGRERNLQTEQHGQ